METAEIVTHGVKEPADNRGPSALKKGTPEGDKLISVRCKERIRYVPSPGLDKMYEIGEVLTIPQWYYTSYHNPPKGIKHAKTGEDVDMPRGSFEPSAWTPPADDNVPKFDGKMQTVMDENERLRKMIAELQAAQSIAPAPQVDTATDRKKSKKEEI